jgi:phosphoribosylpyrophosphate synthetase
LSDEDDVEAEVARELADEAGGYLRNVIREPNVTCTVCTTPIESEYTHCIACNQRRWTSGVADLVVPLAYCIEGQQSYMVFRGYKDHVNEPVRAKQMWIVERLLFLGLVNHKRCIDLQVGAGVDAYVAIPSLSGRQNPHPFVQKTTELGLTRDSLRLIADADATSARIVSANQFLVFPEDADLTGKHVLILDDTWTQGSRTQSAALRLRQHGAKYVSVMVMSRYLRPSWPPTGAFVRGRLQNRDYDEKICPVTGGDCP